MKTNPVQHSGSQKLFSQDFPLLDVIYCYKLSLYVIWKKMVKNLYSGPILVPFFMDFTNTKC